MEELDQIIDKLDESQVAIVVREEDWGAVASPDINDIPKGDAPFSFTTVGNAPSNNVVAERLLEEFERKIDTVYEKITESDDALQAILDMEVDDL